MSKIEIQEVTSAGSADPRRLGLYHRLVFLTKDSGTYGLAAVLNRVLSLITFPLLSRHFSVGEYGLIDLVVVWVTLLTIFFVMGQDAAVARYFYEASDRTARQQVISQSLFQQLALLAIVIPILLIAAPGVASGLLGSTTEVRLIRLAILQVPFFVFVNFSQNILKWTFGKWRFITISVGSAAATAVALVIAMMTSGTMTSVFLGYLIVRAVFGLMGLWFVRDWLVFPKGWYWWRRMLPYAVPFGVVLFLGGLQPAIERGFILKLLTDHELGLYAAGAKVGLLVGLPVFAFQTAWGPFSLSIYREADAARTYNIILKGFAIAVFSAVLILTVVANPLVRVLASDRYSGASSVVFASAFGLALQGIGVVTGVGISFSKKSHLHLWSFLIALSCSALAMLGMARPFGIAGVAYGAALGWFVKTAVDTLLAERVHRIGWDAGPVIWLSAITLAAGVSSAWVAGLAGALAGSALAATGLVILLGFGWRATLDQGERDAVRRRLLLLMSTMNPRATHSKCEAP